MRFEPVFLPDGRGLNGKASQTFLRTYNGCPRAAYLYQSYKHVDLKTVEMVRGTAIHEALARCTLAAIEQDAPAIPPELAKTFVDEVLAEFAVPIEEHDYVRECVYRWAAESAFDPERVVAVETLFVLDVAGFQVRAKIDFAQLLEDGAACLVKDYKSQRQPPPWDEVSRKRPDKTFAAKNFQLILYPLALAFGVPVRVEECPLCRGRSVLREQAVIDIGVQCQHCEDRGHIETPEPFSVASQAQRFDVEFVYPGAEDREGRMATRPMTLTRLELVEYRASLEAILSRVHASEETGDWPAVISDAACSECPAASLCPIPAELRDHRGTVNTPGEAAEAAAVLDREKAEHRARQTELRNWLKANGGSLRYDGKVVELVYSEHEEVFDKDGMFAAMDRAVRYGDHFERSDYVRTKGKTDTKFRDLTENELQEEQDVDGNGAGGRSAEPGESGAGLLEGAEGLDAKFGADAPF